MSKIKSNKRKGSSVSYDTICISSQDTLNIKNSLPSSSNITGSAIVKHMTKPENTNLDVTSNISVGKDTPLDNGYDYMKNSILEEVLNEKKAALLQSPAIMKFLHEEQKRQKENKE